MENALLLFFFTGPPLGASSSTGAATGTSASASDWVTVRVGVGVGVGGSAETAAETERAVCSSRLLFPAASRLNMIWK